MLKTIFNWFVGGKPTVQQPAPTVSPEAVPYKIEAPVPPVQPALTVDGHGDVHPVTTEANVKKPSGARKAAASAKAADKAVKEKKPATAIKATKKPRSKKVAK